MKRCAKLGFTSQLITVLVLTLLAGPTLGVAFASGGTWATKASLLTGRRGLQAEAVGGAVYAIGGTIVGCPEPPALPTEAYDPTNDEWSAKATLPPPPDNGGQRAGFATAVVGGKIYAFGGSNCLIFFDDVQVYDPTTDSWSVRDPMPTARSGGVSAAVNGKIYLIGGYSNPSDSAGSIAPTLEYDPTTDTWTTKADVPTPRIGGPGAAVIGGKIYVVGGASPATGVPVNTLEAYDPATDMWTTLAPMSTDRSVPAVGNVNGLLYAFGGANSSFAIVASGEMYDPALNMWFEAPPLPAARVGAGAAVLGGVLYVIGGQSATVAGNATTFAFTPSGSGSWTATGSMAVKRFYFPGAIVLSDGRVLVAGGFNYQQGSLASAEVYNPATGAWSATGSMMTARCGHAAVLLHNGKVLTVGGFGSCRSSSAELYDPALGTWSATGSMSVSRDSPTATLLPDGKVLVAGGYDVNSNPRVTAEVYDPATGTWSMTGSMATGRHSAATLLLNGKVLVTGGGASMSSAELYDPATATWSTTASMTTGRGSHSAILLPNGTVLVAGGATTGGVFVTSAEIYHPDTGTWSITSSMAGARAAHTATLIPGGRVLVAGGLSANAVGAELASAELYDVATATWSATGSMVSARYIHGAALLHTGKVLVAAGNGFNDNPLASAELYEPTAPSPPSLAASTTTVTCPPSVIYTGGARTPCTATVTGAGGLNQPLPVSYTNNVNAGTATASATFAGDANHTGSGDSKTFTIGQAISTTAITCPASVPYTGAAQTPCTATVTGAGGLSQSVTVNYTNNVDAGTATASATFAGDANHTGSGDSKTFIINVLTPAQATQQLSATVNALVNSGGLTQSEAGALTAKLDAALQAISKGNNTAAKGQLGAFINQVNALVNSNRLPQAQAQALIEAANAVIARL